VSTIPDAARVASLVSGPAADWLSRRPIYRQDLLPPIEQ